MKNLLFKMSVLIVTVGLVKIFIFLFHQWGVLGLLAGLTVIVPVAAPVWEWIATGHCLTFVLVYGGLAIFKMLDPRRHPLERI